MNEILLKKSAGENLSDQEIEEFSDWIKQNPKNELIYYQTKLIFGSVSKQKREFYKNEIREDLFKRDAVGKPKIKSPTSKIYLRIAASIILVAAVAITLLITLKKNDETASPVMTELLEKVSLYGQKLSMVLPDGSKVRLNAGSKLIVPKNFTGGERRVSLQGEAFFEVSEANFPFIVESGKLEIKVLGTSFNIDAYPENNRINVALVSGKVLVESQINQDLILELTPGEMLSYDVGRPYFEMSSYDIDEVLGWKDNLLVFKDMTLVEIMKELNKWYNVNFIFDKREDFSAKFSGKYDNPTLKDVLESLSHAYDFQYKINGTQIKISKPMN